MRMAAIAIASTMMLFLSAPTLAADANKVPVDTSQTSSTPINPAPAGVNGGTAIPEPSDFMLFALGIAGLVIGRQISRRRKKDDQA